MQGLPGQLLLFTAVRFTMPVHDTKHVQAGSGMGVAILARNPGQGVFYVDTQLFMQLAHKCRSRILPGLDLAAGKLPVTRHGFSLRALRQQDPAVITLDYTDGNVEQFTVFIFHATDCVT
jgi:hypothetical protein